MIRTHPNSSPPGRHHDHRTPKGTEGQAEILDLDATVLAKHTKDIIEWLPLRSAPNEIVDLGCGTGAGTFALLHRFPRAHVTAVDSSAELLQRLREKARANGVHQRVRTVRADLDEADWPDLGSPDLVWASASLHHMAEPLRVLHGVYDLLASGGLFAVIELAGFPRFLPEDAPEGHPGLEERCHAASDRAHAGHVPHRGADWGPKLETAGFTVAGERTVSVNVEGSGEPAVGSYALSALHRFRESVAGTLSDDDLTALDGLLDTKGPHSILLRDDLSVRTERRVWAARRDG